MNINFKTFVGKDKQDQDVVLDFSNINSVILVGATGSGKSVFHFNLYKRLLEQNRDNINFVFIDNTRVDFYYFPENDTFRKILKSDDAIKYFDELLEEIRGRVTGKKDKSNLLVVHIEECDEWAADYVKTGAFFKELLAIAKDSNVIVIYSTSRPSVDVVPDWLIADVDLKAIFNLASHIDCQRVLGNDMPLAFEPGERLLVSKEKSYHCMPFTDQELKDIQAFESQK